MAPRVTEALAGRPGTGEPVTTCGVIALVNLQAQISARQTLTERNRLAFVDRAGLVDLLLVRGQVLGRIADYEQVERTASSLVSDEPVQGLALLARARTRAVFHRFAPALADLATAERLGADTTEVDTERAAVHQALGRYDEAGRLLHEAVRRRRDFQTSVRWPACVPSTPTSPPPSTCSPKAAPATAESAPFPLALLDLHRGRMWQQQNDLSQARLWFDSALHRLPDMAPALGCYAQIEAALGETTSAITRLRPLVTSTDDPDYPAQLTILLNATGRTDEGRHWREQAEARYNQLRARHPDAFTDHAASFRLALGET
ncbi:tetratricopeptide repeat protein [Streptomyces sp. NPDC100445]|uniref:tetratricopeptide repeat protein n=1 Tax=Streptomyces sp. NPDC100445 TaxID=3366102 RepID=UPI0037FCC75F